MRAVQLALFGPQSVHVARRDRQAGLICVMCKASLLVAAISACCDTCPGWVEPAPPWAALAAEETVPMLEEAA